MMNPALLDRAAPGFSRGYRDAVAGRKAVYVVDPGRFYEHDYVEGFAAGMNDIYWAAVTENNRLDSIDRRRAARARAEARGASAFTGVIGNGNILRKTRLVTPDGAQDLAGLLAHKIGDPIFAMGHGWYVIDRREIGDTLYLMLNR